MDLNLFCWIGTVLLAALVTVLEVRAHRRVRPTSARPVTPEAVRYVMQRREES